MKKQWMRIMAIVLVLVGLVAAMPQVALAAVRPTGITLDQTTISLDLGGTAKLRVTGKVLPTGASQRVRFRSSNTRVARVSSSGWVTARAVGTAKIGVRPYSGGKWTYIPVTVTDSRVPKAITLDAETVTIDLSSTVQMAATVLPDTASKALVWKSSRSSVARVSANGLIYGRRTGSCLVRAYSKYSGKVYATAKVTVVKKGTPSAIVLDWTSARMEKGATLSLIAQASPSTASQSIKWKTSRKSVATVTANGQVKAVKAGTAIITAYSARSSKVYATCEITVYDPAVPDSITLDKNALYLDKGDTAALKATVLPATAGQSVKWSSSRTSVATVKDGTITAVGIGSATITAQTAVGEKKAVCTVTVLNTNKTTVQPLRYTDVAGIEANIAKIKAVELSARREIDLLAANGTISTPEAAARTAVLERAFAMYNFPWMTLAKQPYWREAASNGGAKDFVPGRVYYGMPYIQYSLSTGSHANRRYNVEKALSENRYYASGKGYYLLNQENLLGGSYCGSDCSAFVSMAGFGLDTANSYLNTTAMATSSAYRTQTDASTRMRPCDVLVRSGSHTVMFLYYTNSAKTQMMIIEQGGGNYETNTICCSVKSVSAYLSAGYIIRRQATFAAE